MPARHAEGVGHPSEAFDSIAAEFDVTRREPWPEVVEFLRALPQGSRVLDLGCGNGRHLRAAAGADLHGIGLDRSAALLEYARGSGALVRGEITRIPVKDDSVDAVLAVAVVHHLSGQPARLTAWREGARGVRKEGVLFASAWALEQERFRHVQPAGPGLGGDTLVPWRTRSGHIVDRFYHLYADGELRAELSGAGLTGGKYFRGEDNYFAVGG